MKQGTSSLRRVAEGGLIAAMYAALTLLIPAASFGTGQFRVSEMLTILPVFTPAAIPGLAVGCLVSNLFGLRSLRVKGLPVAATLPPVLLNAVVVGLELTFALFADPTVGLAALNMLLVGLGQLGACTVCGLILYTALVKTGAATAVFGRYAVESR